MTEAVSQSRIAAPRVTRPDTQHSVQFLGQVERILAGSDDTASEFALLESRAARGHGSPLHIHHDAAETFVVLEGTLRVQLADGVLTAEAGCVAILPKGVAHAFQVDSDTARYLTLHTPAGFDRFVAAAGTDPTAADPGHRLDPDELTAVAARHGIEIIGPASLL